MAGVRCMVRFRGRVLVRMRFRLKGRFRGRGRAIVRMSFRLKVRIRNWNMGSLYI